MNRTVAILNTHHISSLHQREHEQAQQAQVEQEEAIEVVSIHPQIHKVSLVRLEQQAAAAPSSVLQQEQEQKQQQQPDAKQEGLPDPEDASSLTNVSTLKDPSIHGPSAMAVNAPQGVVVTSQRSSSLIPVLEDDDEEEEEDEDGNDKEDPIDASENEQEATEPTAPKEPNQQDQETDMAHTQLTVKRQDSLFANSIINENTLKLALDEGMKLPGILTKAWGSAVSSLQPKSRGGTNDGIADRTQQQQTQSMVLIPNRSRNKHNDEEEEDVEDHPDDVSCLSEDYDEESVQHLAQLKQVFVSDLYFLVLSTAEWMGCETQTPPEWRVAEPDNHTIKTPVNQDFFELALADYVQTMCISAIDGGTGTAQKRQSINDKTLRLTTGDSSVDGNNNNKSQLDTKEPSKVSPSKITKKNKKSIKTRGAVLQNEKDNHVKDAVSAKTPSSSLSVSSADPQEEREPMASSSRSAQQQDRLASFRQRVLSKPDEASVASSSSSSPEKFETNASASVRESSLPSPSTRTVESSSPFPPPSESNLGDGNLVLEGRNQGRSRTWSFAPTPPVHPYAVPAAAPPSQGWRVEEYGRDYTTISSSNSMVSLQELEQHRNQQKHHHNKSSFRRPKRRPGPQRRSMVRSHNNHGVPAMYRR